MDIEKDSNREAFDEWHYNQYLLENPNIDISNAKYIYDYAHKNVLVFQLKESHFTAWQAAIARMEVRINTLDEMLLNQGEALAQAKAKAVPKVIDVGNELQSWVAVNSFSADDGDGVLPVVDANAIAEKIEELTGANA